MRPESDWTQPSPWCPNPAHWHAHDAMATEVEVIELLAAFTRALQPDIVIETGTYRGHAAAAIGTALQANGHGHLWTLEHDEREWRTAREAVAGLPVTALHENSLHWTPPGPIDFAWFDSEPGIRAEEYRHMRPWMHERTIVGFHDTAPHHHYRPQLDTLDLNLIDLPTPRGVTFGRIAQ